LLFGCGSGWSAQALVALGGVEDEFAEKFAGGGVYDADVEVVDEHEDVGSGVGSADADGVELALVAQGDFAGLVDAVAAQPLVSLKIVLARFGLRAGLVGGGGGGVPGQGPVWPAVVVLVDEGVDQRLELSEVGRLAGLGA
jgi:hypothetical protein